MASVTQRTKQVKQPYGGFLPVKNMQVLSFDDGNSLSSSDNENIHPSLIGLAVDYLFRYMQGESVEDAFSISLLGAEYIGEEALANALLNHIIGLDDESIVCACKLVGFDVCYRTSANNYVPVQLINPNESTIRNIRIMVCRCVNFFDTNGPIIQANITFDGGYTSTISSGDADYMTSNALWDLKVSKSAPTSKHTLQLLIYYVMGLHSIYPQWQNVEYLGIFNPRLQRAYFYQTSLLPQELIYYIETEIIGYSNAPEPNFFDSIFPTYSPSKHRDIKKARKKRKRPVFTIKKFLFLLFVIYGLYLSLQKA